jgi:hypothetical protein
MKVNFQSIALIPDNELEAHGKWLAGAGYDSTFLIPPCVDTGRSPPEGYEEYVCVDVLGPEFVWMNESFPKEKFTWYLWFESVFLVTPDMATYLKLRWA